MKIPSTALKSAGVLTLASTLMLAACGQGEQTRAGDRLDGDAAPTYPGEGGAGLVETPEGAPAGATAVPGLSGGPAEQTPGYGEPGGVPAEAHSDPAGQAGHSENAPPNP